MKVFRITLFFLTLFSYGTLSKAQTQTLKNETEYCILRIVIGNGVGSVQKGVFIIYEDLKLEKYELKEINHEYLLRVTMDFTSLLKNKGFEMVATSHTSSINGDVYEYIFRKSP
ncbi:MAG: hypothetical protein NZ529_00135 [Cytophagaceae bacterium]|nr:hypothetical protein [Cytophagaceae bacterium]MDW8455173.1 hypothetical protein [Cytophagaceae bacterium]